MKKRVVFAALGLAAGWLAIGQSSAEASHCRTGYGVGYGGFYAGVGVGVAPVYPVAPNYGCGNCGYRYPAYPNYGYGYRGPAYPPQAVPYGNVGYYGPGSGTNIQVITPGYGGGLGY
jgi:hypothetical protein